MENKKIVIVAPHPDDEIIGCFSYLQKASCICFGSPISLNEKRNIGQWYTCDVMCLEEPELLKLPDAGLYLFPDPYFETHPLHRKWGMVGETLLRKETQNQSTKSRVLFYSVNMQAPYIFETQQPEKKRAFLDTIYPDKADLWKYDHKYFLFEGYCEWIRK